ncbi:unnamed protein product [Prorocentrum cordatum]|uniref:Uncharacterized protein n=1 Tax=Prorocentrum cordatum TaxID=2364126 RepID=A0ABN9TZY8_9DINO|nr:unnamed protein product [Polarella glacialis]
MHGDDLRLVARVVVCQHVALAKKFFLRHPWLHELVDADVTRHMVVLKANPEIHMRFVKAQRSEAMAKNEDIQTDLEAEDGNLRVSDRRRLLGQGRAFQRRAAQWSVLFLRRHLVEVELQDGRLVASTVEIHEALANHFGGVFCPTVAAERKATAAALDGDEVTPGGLTRASSSPSAGGPAAANSSKPQSLNREQRSRERDAKAVLAKYGVNGVEWGSLAPPSLLNVEEALRARPAAPGAVLWRG